MPTNDDELLTRALEGDRDSFADLYRRVHPPLVRYLRTLVADEADDVAAEAWAQALRDLRKFKGDAVAFRAWVATIGRHRALDLHRTRVRRPATATDPAKLPDAAEPVDLTEESLATRRALALIAELPHDQAEAVLLRVVMGLDAPSAARVLGKRPGAVRMATSRGLATLRENLDVTLLDPDAL